MEDREPGARDGSPSLDRRQLLVGAGRFAALASTAGVLGACGRSGSTSDPGVSKDQILVGTTQPLSGPVASFGTAYRDGLLAYFAEVNARGGVDGRKIKLLVYDDGYQVPKTVELTRKLVEGDRVFATLFQLGTPTNQAINPYLTRMQIPNFPASNGSFLASPSKSPWTVVPTGPTNTRAGELVGTYVAQNHKGSKVGSVYQNDQLGLEYLKGFQGSVERGGGQLAAAESYELTDATLDTQVIKLHRAGVQVWFLAAATKYAALAVRKAAEIGWTPQIYAIQQATDGKTMKAMGKAATDRLVTFQTLKDPASPQYANDAAIKSFQEILRRRRPGADGTDLRVIEGMAEAKLFAAMAQRMKDPTRQALVDAYRSLKSFDTGAYLAPFSARKGSNFLADGLLLARWDGSRFNPIGSLLT
jgi:branched-chain amino acid transport system substrate-binding protein